MSNHIRNSLLGKKFEATIGEPWDFKSLAGPNRLEGMIKAISSQEAIFDWLLLEITPFTHGTNTIKQVIAVNRYSKNQNILDQLFSNEKTTLNFMFLLDGHELTEEKVPMELSNEKQFSFLVGSINNILSH